MSTAVNSLREFKFPAGIATIDDVVTGFKAYQVLRTALELGLFEWLDREGSCGREGITAGLKLNGMFTRSFLQSLVDLGLLTGAGDTYRLTEIAENFLVQRSPAYQGDWFKMLAEGNSKWGNLKEVLTGEKPAVGDSETSPSRDFIHSLAQRSLRGELQAVAREIVAWDDFKQAKTLLDLGGGHGLYAIALCEASPGLHGVIFDKPHVALFAREFIEQYHLLDRLEVRGGDIRTDSLGQGYDIIIISHLLYKFRRELPAIFQRISEALNPGGLLVTNHWFCSPGCGMSEDGLHELDTALQSFGHPLCHIEDFTNFFRNEGLEVIRALDVPSIHGLSKLHLAVKSLPKGETTLGLGHCDACC